MFISSWRRRPRIVNLADTYFVFAVIVWILLSFRSTTHLAGGTSPAKAEP